MICQSNLVVCSNSGSNIGLIAPSTGVYILRWDWLGVRYTDEVTLTEGDEIATQRDMNEASQMTLRIIKDGSFLSIDDIDKWYIEFIQCKDVAITSTPVQASTFNLYYKDLSDDITLDGVVVDDANLVAGFTTDYNVSLFYPSSGVRYNLEIFMDTGKLIEGFHYNYNRTSGAITFTHAPEFSLVELKFTRV